MIPSFSDTPPFAKALIPLERVGTLLFNVSRPALILQAPEFNDVTPLVYVTRPVFRVFAPLANVTELSAKVFRLVVIVSLPFQSLPTPSFSFCAPSTAS